MRDWTPEEYETLVSLMNDGKTYAEIAKAIDRSPAAVKQMVERLRARTAKQRSGKTKETICWYCVNAVPTRDRTAGCSWSRKLKPVDGWEVERTIRTENEYTGEKTCGYIVVKCPEFKPG